MAGKYQVYSEYVYSGFNWLGNIPKHWKVTPIKWQIEKVDGGAWGLDPDGDGDTVVLRSTEQTADGQWIIEDPAIRKLSEHEAAATLLAKDDLLMTKSSGSSLHIGKTSIVTEEVANLLCGYSNFMQRIRIKKKYVAKFYWYIFNNDLGRKQLDYLSNSTTGLANLNATMIGDILGPVPSYSEQVKITNFLDYETAKIDTVIEKQHQLITLLKEKRQAVISNAVTKGLNPNAPMRDSGVEWLGEVPAHWGCSSVKNLCYVNDGNHGEEYPTDEDFVDVDEGVPFIRGGDFDDFKIVDKELRYISHAKNNSMRKGRLQVNDILFVNRGATIGKLCIIDEEYSGSNLNSQIAYLRADTSLVEYRYLTYFLSSSYIQAKIFSEIQGGALPQYPLKHIVNLDVFLGHKEEQILIADFLDEQVANIKKLINKCESTIKLMQERRTALISAAVTGKIDVRDWVAPNDASKVTLS